MLVILSKLILMFLSQEILQAIKQNDLILPSPIRFNDPYLYDIDLIDGFFQTMRFMSKKVFTYERLGDFLSLDNIFNILKEEFGIVLDPSYKLTKRNLMISFHKKISTTQIASINKLILNPNGFFDSEIVYYSTDSITVLATTDKIKQYMQLQIQRKYHIRITQYIMLLSKTASKRLVYIL